MYSELRLGQHVRKLSVETLQYTQQNISEEIRRIDLLNQWDRGQMGKQIKTNRGDLYLNGQWTEPAKSTGWFQGRSQGAGGGVPETYRAPYKIRRETLTIFWVCTSPPKSNPGYALRFVGTL